MILLLQPAEAEERYAHLLQLSERTLADAGIVEVASGLVDDLFDDFGVDVAL